MAWMGGNEGKPVGVADMLNKLVIIYVTGYHRDVPTRKYEQNRIPGMPMELAPKDQLHADIITIDRVTGAPTVYRDQTIRSWAVIKVARNCVGGDPLLGTMFSPDGQANKATWQALHTNPEAVAAAEAWLASLGAEGFTRSQPREPEVHTAPPVPQMPAAPPWAQQQPPWMMQQPPAGYGQPMPPQQPPWAQQPQQGGWNQPQPPVTPHPQQQGGWNQPPQQAMPTQQPPAWGQQQPQPPAPTQQGGWGQPQPVSQQPPAWGQQPQQASQQGGWGQQTTPAAQFPAQQPGQQYGSTLDAMAAAGMLAQPQQAENPPF